MTYRKYKIALTGLMVAISVSLVGCAGSSFRGPDSIDDYDGNEPQQQRVNHKDLGWLDGVQDEFGKVAARSSNRSLASLDKEVLLKKNNFSFFYQKTNNQFFLNLNGQTYHMTQTNLGDDGHYAFAAEGAVDNPPTLSISGLSGIRGPASTSQCNVALSYFNQGNASYKQDKVNVGSKSCVALTQRLKDYVP